MWAMDFRVTLWVVCLGVSLVRAGPTTTSLPSSVTWNQPSAHSIIRGGGGSVTLSGSSSRPVQPIKPLLDLSAGVAARKGDQEGDSPKLVDPVFDQAAPRNVSSLANNAAYLHCLVHNLGTKSVSWIRQRDLHILTVGRYTYTTDQRFEVIHSPDSQDWILKISYAQVRDSGVYECQVSSKPVRSYPIHLSVYASPHATIVGSPDMHVDKGSTINLTCVVSHSPEPPSYVFWYHNHEMVKYDSPRGGITVVTERGNNTRGYLLIQDAQPSDTGNYSCVPSNTALTSLTVHVLKGESPAAMQTSGGACTVPITTAHRVLILLLMMMMVAPLWRSHTSP